MTITTDPTETPSERPKPKAYPLKPMLKLAVKPGEFYKTSRDLIMADESEDITGNIDEWNGAGGETEFISKGSVALLVELSQFRIRGKIFIRGKFLAGETCGWATLVEVSVNKDWKWMIPPKQRKWSNEAIAKFLDPYTEEDAEADALIKASEEEETCEELAGWG